MKTQEITLDDLVGMTKKNFDVLCDLQNSLLGFKEEMIEFKADMRAQNHLSGQLSVTMVNKIDKVVGKLSSLEEAINKK